MSWTTDMLVQILNKVTATENKLNRLTNTVNDMYALEALMNNKLDQILAIVTSLNNTVPGGVLALLELVKNEDTEILAALAKLQSELTPNPAVGFTATLQTD